MARHKLMYLILAKTINVNYYSLISKTYVKSLCYIIYGKLEYLNKKHKQKLAKQKEE